MLTSMGLWDKVKETAQKAADAAKEQVNREDSILNKTIDGTKKAADKAVLVAKDQVHRQDSSLNSVRARAAAASDNILGKIDEIDSNRHDSQVEMARRYAARRKQEAMGDLADVDEAAARPAEERSVGFPNSMDLTDDEVYTKVSESIYPGFRTLPAGDKKWALCEIARFDKKIVNQMRAIGSAYIDTVRQLADGDDAYQAALDAAGLARDPELRAAFRAWHDDTYEEAFYADDDGGHTKAVRLLGWLVYERLAGEGEEPGATLTRAFSDAGVRDVYGVARHVARAAQWIAAREQVVIRAFKPRRAEFKSQFLVHKGINADVNFMWIEPDGQDPGDEGGEGGDGGGFAGGSLMEL